MAEDARQFTPTPRLQTPSGLELAELEIVGERIDVRRCDIGVGGEILVGIEVDRRVTPFVPARLRIVVEWVDAGRRNIRILRQIT
jgi:hypothetical protein